MKKTFSILQKIFLITFTAVLAFFIILFLIMVYDGYRNTPNLSETKELYLDFIYNDSLALRTAQETGLLGKIENASTKDSAAYYWSEYRTQYHDVYEKVHADTSK